MLSIASPNPTNERIDENITKIPNDALATESTKSPLLLYFYKQMQVHIYQ